MRTASQISTNQFARQGPTGKLSSQLLNVATTVQFSKGLIPTRRILAIATQIPTHGSGWCYMRRKRLEWAGAAKVPLNTLFRTPSIGRRKTSNRANDDEHALCLARVFQSPEMGHQ